MRDVFEVVFDPDRNLRKRTVEFTGGCPSLQQIAKMHGIKIARARPNPVVCGARELAPCTNPACAHCWQRRRPMA